MCMFNEILNLGCVVFCSQERYTVISRKVRIPYTMKLDCTGGTTQTSKGFAEIEHGTRAQMTVDPVISLVCLRFFLSFTLSGIFTD